jgi:hypothetical protein
MKVPTNLRKQFKEYEKAGFRIVDLELLSGSHCKVRIEGIDTPQFLTRNADEPRAIKNNIARFRRLSKEKDDV